MGMIGHFGVGPIWTCVNVDDCYNPSFRGTLSHVNSLEMFVERAFVTDYV
jgi:hypothetical protein